MEYALRFFTCLYLDRIASAFSNKILYTIQGICTVLTKFAWLSKKLLTLFQFHSFSVAIAHDVTRPSLSAAVAIDVKRVAQGMSNTKVIVFEALTESSHAPYMASVVPAGTHINSSTIARLPMEPRLNAATKATIAIQMKYDVLGSKKASKPSNQSLKALATQEALMQAVKSVCWVCKKKLQNLRGKSAFQGRKMSVEDKSSVTMQSFVLNLPPARTSKQ